MKVLHVEAGRYLYGGARQVLYIAQGVAQAGHDSIVVCPEGAVIATAARELGLEVIELPMKGDADVGLVFRLRRLIRQHNPDIVHLHSRRGADIFGGLAAKWCGVPSVVSRRVDNPESTFVTRWKYGLFNHVITISEGIRQVLIAQGLDPTSVSCVRSALVAEEFQSPRPRADFLKEFDLADEAIVLGVVAQLIERKGHRFLFEVLPRVLTDHPNVRVIIFGQGPGREPLEQRVLENGLSDSVQFAGFREDMPDWLAHLNILVHPALMEGLGISLLQASAAGVPIVASRAGGMPEAVKEGETGLLITPGNTAELETALRSLLDDVQRAQGMGEAGKRYIEEEFSVARMVEGNLAVYRGITEA